MQIIADHCVVMLCVFVKWKAVREMSNGVLLSISRHYWMTDFLRLMYNAKYAAMATRRIAKMTMHTMTATTGLL